MSSRKCFDFSTIFAVIPFPRGITAVTRRKTPRISWEYSTGEFKVGPQYGPNYAERPVSDVKKYQSSQRSLVIFGSWGSSYLKNPTIPVTAEKVRYLV